MVKDATKRSDKYSAKNDPDAMRIRVDKYKVNQDANAVAPQAAIAGHQQAVRDILDSYGIAAILSVAYQAIGMKLYGLSNKFKAATLQLEATRALNNFSTMGLDEPCLIAIAAHFGVTWSAP
jgi:hypothetical protein